MSPPTGKLKFAYETIANLECKIKDLNEECERLANSLGDVQKAYNKQHSTYKDIFFSLAKVERENEELKQQLEEKKQ